MESTDGFLDAYLPPGWIEAPQSDGPKEYWACADGSTGVLQVSRLPDHFVATLSAQQDLGVIAATLGARLGGAEQSWGTPTANQHGDCASGRYGFAMFEGGQYEAMFLWVTLSAKTALMWTWFGPSVLTPEVRQAAQVVLGSRF